MDIRISQPKHGWKTASLTVHLDTPDPQRLVALRAQLSYGPHITLELTHKDAYRLCNELIDTIEHSRQSTKT